MKARHSRMLFAAPGFCHGLLAIAFVVATASTAAAQSPVDLRADAVADDGTVIDVLLLYTPAARAAAGGVAQVQAIASRIIVETNTVFGNSLINPRVRLVGVIELPYTEAVDIDLDLQNLRAGPARALRDSSHADLVQLLVASADPTACGRSYQLAE